MKILIAEDEKQIANSLKKNFADEGYSAVIVEDGEEAVDVISKNDFDVLLLDWRMPKLTGLEVCKRLRKIGYNKPIVLLTALSDVKNKVEALNHGADDYITKPFSFEEVLARINAVLRRYEKTSTYLEFDEYKLDLINHTLITSNSKIKLPEKEFELLKYFLENPGIILNKDRLCHDVWELPFTPSTNLVEVTIKNLRNKLEELTGKKYIKTIYGEGYLFIVD